MELGTGVFLEGLHTDWQNTALSGTELNAKSLARQSRNQTLTVKRFCTLNHFGFKDDSRTLTAR
jgi:hypothetical protein